MKKVIQPIFFVLFSFLICNTGKAQSDSVYSIIVAGHAYGAHAGTNIGLHPPFLETLKANIDSTVKAVFLTGDIVNYSTTASWQQVAKELSEFDINSYYVMGNHDDNTTGHNVFQQKHGGTYYSFSYENELFIVLNSTESDRSISATQLVFLDGVLKNANSNETRVFIFFHEIIWNSNDKYKLVRSNSRSRYDQIKGHSNFWEEVYPMLTSYPERKFYLFAGDVGGNPDAIAASYDKWGNVTLLSSGMGEVPDENYMKVDILPDTVKFTLVPLDEGIEMNPIIWYNVPEKPVSVIGPDTVIPPQNSVEYQATSVFNATSYQWILGDGISGISDSASIFLDFDPAFKSGQISVSAINDGFGESEPVVLEIKSSSQTPVSGQKINNGFWLFQNGGSIQINCNSDKKEKAYLKVYNSVGKLLLSDDFQLNPGLNTKNIDKNKFQKGVMIFDLSTGTKRYVQKIFQ